MTKKAINTSLRASANTRPHEDSNPASSMPALTKPLTLKWVQESSQYIKGLKHKTSYFISKYRIIYIFNKQASSIAYLFLLTQRIQSRTLSSIQYIRSKPQVCSFYKFVGINWGVTFLMNIFTAENWDYFLISIMLERKGQPLTSFKQKEFGMRG